jgi:phage tail sheath protein FI
VSAYTYPGVYIEELPSGVHTITGVATSIAAFAGWAPQGSVDEAVLVQSWLDYQSQFGGLDQRSLLGYAVNQFFGNGGHQAYIVRVAQMSAITTGTGTAPSSGGVTVPATGGSLAFTAKTVGGWSNSYGIQIVPDPSPATTFSLLVVYAPAGAPLAVMETFPGLTASASPTITSNFVTMTVNGPPTANPAAGFFAMSGGADGDGVNVPAAAEASGTIYQPSSTTLGFTFTANNPGAWGNLIAISAKPQSAAMDPTGTRFSLNVITVGPGGVMQVVETYNNLSVVVGDPFYVVTVLNADSAYVSVVAAGVATQALNNAQPSTISATSPTPLTGSFLAGGYDGIVLDPTLDNSGGQFETALNTAGTATGGLVYGIHLLDRVPIFNLLCVPGESDPQAISALQAYCAASTIRAFYIVDCKQTDTFKTLENGPPSGTTGLVAANSAFYFPWVSAPDPLAGSRPRAFPPCGFVAGIYAATDASRGVWKAPAGIDASLSGIQGLEFNLTDLENGTLNTQAINCLRQFRVYGNVVWGSRTLQGNDQAGSQWKYVPIRRFALFLETSLYDGTQWAVFEPNDSTLWGQLRMNIGSFMQGLFLQGAFQGTTPSQAYFVKCDGENNPQTSIDQGIVNVTVGFAPLYPAEFVVIQIQQMAGQTQS